MTIRQLEEIRALKKKTDKAFKRLKSLEALQGVNSSYINSNNIKKEISALLSQYVNDQGDLIPMQLNARRKIEKTYSEAGYHGSILINYYLYAMPEAEICKLYNRSLRWFWQQLKKVKSLYK